MRNSIIAFFLFNYILFSQEIEFKGYFDYTYNNDNGKITLAIDKLDQEFLYVNSLSRGVGNNDLGLDRGQLGNARVVYFTKKGDKIFLIDWRESFGNDLEIGDFYYDLAKLYHGLIINGTIAKEKKLAWGKKMHKQDWEKSNKSISSGNTS